MTDFLLWGVVGLLVGASALLLLARLTDDDELPESEDQLLDLTRWKR